MLVINATQIRKNYSGVGVYSKKIIERIIPKWNEGKIYTQLNEFGAPAGWNIEIVKNTGRDLLRWLWIQLILPHKIKNRDDVLFSTFSESPVNCKCKTVLVIHDLMPLKFPERHSKKLRYYYSKILPKSLRNASKIITISKFVKSEVLEYFPFINESKLTVIYNGYEKKLFNPSLLSDESFRIKHKLKEYILYVGRISEIKNTLTLIKAFGEIASKSEIELLVIGRDESNILPKAREYIARNNFGDKVKFIDYLSENELADAYKSSKIFVLPSFSEGFGLPVIEAMACGIPVIISDIPALCEIADDSAMKFNPENHIELSEKLLLLLHDNELYNNMKERGLKRAELFDWNKAALLTNNVILDVMNNK